MISTADCLAAIAKEIPSYGKDWKRISKKKDSHGRDVRIFQNKKDVSVVVTVIATKDEIVQVIPPVEKANLKGVSKKDLIEKIKANKITIPLVPTSPEENEEDGEDYKEAYKDLTGRVIYCNGEVHKKEDGTIEEFTFFCGAEAKSGYISDMQDGGLDAKLGDLFEDLNEVAHSLGEHCIDIGAAENMHAVYPLKGFTPDELWALIRKRLDRSGAVPAEK